MTRSLVLVVSVVLCACSGSSGGGQGGGTANGGGSATGGSSGSGGGSAAGGGAATGGGSSSGGGSAAGGGSATGGGSGGGSVDAGACAPSPSCISTYSVAKPACLGLVDNSSAAPYALRMNEIDFTLPASFASGILATTIGNSAQPALPSCNVSGQGTFSWLIAVGDGGTVTTGGALPISMPDGTWKFADAMQGGFHVQPTALSGTLSGGGTFNLTAGAPVVMPAYLDSTGTAVLILPLHALTLQGTLSSDRSCIGTYNAGGLDPGNNCAPNGTTPAFLTGGTGNGFISLDEADTVTIAALSQTLCVLLSGDATMYGTQMGSLTVCKRDVGGKIVFQGDWCSISDSPGSSGGCADAMHVSFNYAAGSVHFSP
jgi:hypothetical protein